MKDGTTQDHNDNPYLWARQEWLERYGSYIKRASQWRITALLALVIAATSAAGNVMQLQQQKIVPYVVETDRQGGIQAVGAATEPGRIPEKVIQATIADVITNWRTVTVDTSLQKSMIDSLTMHTAGAASGVLKGWYSQNNPYQIAKSGKLIQVEIKGLPLPVSKDSYRVEWIETVRSFEGVQMEQQSFEAIATVAIIPPTSEAVVLKNPGGVYITSLSAAKIIKK